MVADRKRRHFSRAWSLPVVVAIMFLLAVKLAAIQRADVIAELADQVAHGETQDAASAVRNLAQIPRPPLAELVAAATSPNLAVAREAQHAIDDYLRFCQREIRTGRRVRQVAAQLTVLAESLAQRQPSFAVADYPWLECTTRKVLLLANRIASRKTPLVAESCDEIFAAISAALRPGQSTHLADAATRADAEREANSRQMRRDQRLAVLAEEPWNGSPPDVNDDADSDTVSPPSSSAMDAAAIPLSVSVERWAANQPPTLVFNNAPPRSASPNELRDSGWQAQWSHPVLRTLPARPIHATPIPKSRGDRATGGLQSQRGEDADNFATAGKRFSGVDDSRKLLARWLVAEGSDVYPLEEALTERGFGRLSARLVEQLFSDRVDDRLRLIDDVLTEPGVDARPWLLLLADDPDADARLVVVTIMATSNDRALVEKAWQVAIRDRDPRIAGLADRLRERRVETRRR